MKKFLIKSTYFFIPILLYIVITQFLLYRIKEHLPIVSIIDKQQKSEEETYYNRVLYGNALNMYKYNTLLEKKPEILVLGQSIVLCFRDFFFEPFKSDFYNTGLMLRNITDLEYITNQLLDGTLTKPRYILFGLDHSFVLKHAGLDNMNFNTSIWDDPYFDSKKQLKAMQQVALKSDIREMPMIDIGFGKRGMVGNGYRKDGSCNNKWEIDLFTNDSVHAEGVLIDEFNKHERGYPMPMNFDNEKADRVISSLNKLRDNNIEVLVYIPPLSDEFFTKANKQGHFRTFWNQYTIYQNHLISNGFDVIPFATPSKYGLNDYFMLSSDHPGEIFVARQFVDFYKTKKHTAPVSSQFNLQNLELLINQAKHPLSFQIENQCITITN